MSMTVCQTRIQEITDDYKAAFGEVTSLRYFSAPGRVELCGNHTDHQGGQVVALAVDLDILGAATKRDDGVVRLYSHGQPPCRVDLLGPCPPRGTSHALIWGVSHWLQQHGYGVGGFDCVTRSRVPVGSGLSSSAAFENLVATVVEGLHNTKPIPPVDKALAGQWAEVHCFGKPCGLMDQLASCLGNVSFMDFAHPLQPVTHTLPMPLEGMERVLCVVKTGGSHADLTHLYAAIPDDMKKVAAYFGASVLSQITKDRVQACLPALRQEVGDRAVLRSLNYFDECRRSRAVLTALQQQDYHRVLALVEQSGFASQTLLQNVTNPKDTDFDGVGMALYLSRQLCPDGAFRVHGGGFGGTMLGLVPTNQFKDYRQGMEQVFGKDSCIALQVRSHGGVEVFPQEQ